MDSERQLVAPIDVIAFPEDAAMRYISLTWQRFV